MSQSTTADPCGMASLPELKWALIDASCVRHREDAQAPSGAAEWWKPLVPGANPASAFPFPPLLAMERDPSTKVKVPRGATCHPRAGRDLLLPWVSQGGAAIPSLLGCQGKLVALLLPALGQGKVPLLPHLGAVPSCEELVARRGQGSCVHLQACAHATWCCIDKVPPSPVDLVS